jgi:N-acetyltransferase 10
MINPLQKDDINS